MGLFQRKQSYLGVDIGTSSVKVVELRNESGRPHLVTYGYAEHAADIIKSDAPETQAQLAALLQKILRKSQATSRRVIAALPSFAVFTSIISLPMMSEKDLLAAIRWEAKKFVPMPLDEMFLDWRLLKEQERQQPALAAAAGTDRVAAPPAKPNHMKVLLTAAPKVLVQRYVALFKTAGLELVSLETEAFALERSLLGNDPSPVMIIDIGAMATDMSVIVRGIPVLNRSIDVGGEAFTKAIMRSLNVDATRAEQFKRDFGIASSQSNEQIPRALEFVIGSILNETRYCLNLFQGQSPQPVEKIILAGGSAFLANLPEYLSRMLNLKVYIGDPWARIAYPVELRATLQEVGPRFAVAIGLAMRDLG